MSKSGTRRFRQFTLRAMFVAMAVCAAWLGVVVNRAQKQRQAVDALLEIGALITYDYQMHPDGNYVDSPQPPGPRWLRECLGEEYFVTVVQVAFNEATDEQLRRARPHLENLPDMTSFHATHSELLTDEGIRELAGLGQIEKLWLGGNPKLTGAALGHLKDLRQLQVLEVWHAELRDDDLRQLRGLSELETLEISFTGVGDAGLEHLADLPRLKRLGLCENPVTDEGLKTLAKHGQLQSLDLGWTRVTDAGLESLAKCEELRDLSLRNTKVTPGAVRRLRTALGNAQINYP